MSAATDGAAALGVDSVADADAASAEATVVETDEEPVVVADDEAPVDDA